MINLKNFFCSKEKTVTRLKISFSLFAFIISLSSLLLTIYSDIIVQNNNDISGALSENEKEMTLEELVNGGRSGEIEKQKNIYIFALDISDDLKKKSLSDNGKLEYKQAVTEVNNSINGKRLKENGNHPNIRDFSKARLSGILTNLLNKNKKQAKDEFAIWTVGDFSQRIYPNDIKISVGTQSIESAVNAIELLTEHSSSPPNFTDLFTRLTNEFKDQLESDDTFLVLTILSNLSKDGVERNKEIENRWGQLEDKVQEISYAKVMVNIIMLDEGDQDIQNTIIPLFKRNIEWYRLKKESLMKGDNKSFLYTVWNSDKSIIFPYVNPFYIENSSFVIKNTWDSPCNIKMDMPSEINQYPIPRMSVFCKDDGRKMRLISGGTEFEVNLKIDQTLKLTYSGRLPPNFSSPVLRLSFEDKCITLLIPIDFIKKLPGWAYYIYIILRAGIWISGLISAVFLISILILKYFLISFREEFPEPVLVLNDLFEENISNKVVEVRKRKNAKPISIKLKLAGEIVDINTASYEKLQLLPGIGQRIASIIIEKRPFKNLEDLNQIGVKKNDIVKLKKYLIEGF